MANEVYKFDQLGESWWNIDDGEFKLLHKINPLRIEFIKRSVAKHFLPAPDENAFHKLKVLDIGCGGGLASIPMARLGAEVTGIDPSKKAIASAKKKAKSLGLKNVNYINVMPEEFKPEHTFDLILCLDVVEHIDDLEGLAQTMVNLLTPGGAIVISSINKTAKSFLFAIIAAEYLLNMVPQGTHTYGKFVRPSDLENAFKKNNMRIKKLQGISLSIFKQKWQFTDDISVNYLAYLC